MPSAGSGGQTAWLESLSPWPEEFGLARMHALLAALGNPEDAFQAIHVVGTNGKSTTARMIEELLAREGITVGAFLSPHVERWSERIRVAGREADFEQAIARVRREAEAVEATQFETLAAAALAEFRAAGVTVAVVEAGLGGRLDATNVLRTVMVVLTNVSLEHTAELGSTREQIAREKLAVIRPGCIAVLGEPEWESLARSNGASEIVVEAGGNLPLAEKAAESFLGYAVDPAPTVALPGRLEVRNVEPFELWDGAHNVDGVRFLLDRLPARRFVLVSSIVRDKDVDEMLRLFARASDHLVATTAPNPRALPAAELALRARPFFGRVDAIAEPSDALLAARAAAGPSGAVLVSGSLYLLSSLAAARSRRGTMETVASA